MNVYIITKEPFPNGMASTQRIKCYAQAIAPYVNKVEVLVYIRTEQDSKRKNHVSGFLNSIPYKYISGKTIESSNLLLKSFHYLFDRIRLLVYLKKRIKKGDVVFAYVNSDVRFTLFLIRFVHKLGAIFIRDLCEIPYGTGIESKSNIRKRNITFKYQFPLLDGVISISDNLSSMFSKYNPKVEVLKVPILVDFDSCNNKSKVTKDSRPFIFHCGTLYEQKDGILGLLEAVCLANVNRTNKILLKCTGNINKSPHAKGIREIISKYDADEYIKFTGYLSEDELKENIAKASLVVINKYINQQNTYCFSTKLAEYMAASKAIIITQVGEAMNWLTDKENAIIIPPGNTKTLSTTINRLIDNVSLCEKLGNNANEFCRENFDYRVYGKTIIEYFKSIIR